jgi:hypothetical protein
MLSKSQYLIGTQCRKAIWLLKHRKDLKKPLDKTVLSIMEEGQEIGRLAQELYPNGKLVKFSNWNFDELLFLTQKYIDSGIETIYEAAFKHDDVFAQIDILSKGSNGWELCEVKSSTGLREVFLEDIALQYYVATKSGLPISKVFLLHINTEYCRKRNLSIKKLFKKVDITKIILEKQLHIEKNISKIKEAIAKEQESKKPIGLHCLKPYECRYKDYCWQHIPQYSIFNLAGIDNELKFKLYDQGILKIEDIPSNFPLPKNKRFQVDCEVNNTEIINKEAISSFLDSLSYPLYFLDFESFQKGIPPFKNTRPYQQIPFQYSLHYLSSSTAKLKHYQFLAAAGKEPRLKLIKNLISRIPKKACVLGYSNFEKQIIKSLAQQYPVYKDRLMNIHNNILDLMIPFQKKHFYRKEMQGSHSIKYVLPALAPELSYSSLEISNGQIASKLYATLHTLKDYEQIKKIRYDLFEYCKMDTFAMVRLVEKLRELIL